MAKLTEKEKKEFKKLSQSSQLRRDTQTLLKTRYNPFAIKDKIDLDKMLIFLTDYNSFIGHMRRKLSKIIDKNMRL